MNTLRQTSYELRQLRSNEMFGMGLHLGEELAVGVPGIPISEVPFEASRHPVSAIDPNAHMSILEGRNGRLFVSEVAPFRKLAMNVIIHNETTPERIRRMPHYVRPILERQLALADSLKEALDDCAQFGDEVNTYVLGDHNPFKDRPDIQFRKAETKNKFAKEAATIATNGLSFVISSFHEVPLRPLKTVAKTTPVVAIKANHKLHLGLPEHKDIGDVPVDNGRMIDTSDRREVVKYNLAVAENHRLLEASLAKRRSGMALAKAVYDPNFAIGFDAKATDKSIAAAIRSLV